jgi:capsular exopolysaccharide synthesis family protein
MVPHSSEQHSQRTGEHVEDIDFQKYWLVLKRRWLPAVLVFGSSLALALAAAVLEQPTYQAEGKVRFKSDRTSALTGLEEERGTVEVLTFQDEPLKTQAEIVKSMPVMEKALMAAQVTNQDVINLEPEDLFKKTKVKAVPGTEILQISASSSEPAAAAAIVNGVIWAYKELNIQSNKEEAAAARRFIEQQLPRVEEKVLAAESALSRFKDDNGVIVLEEEASNAVARVSELDQQIEQGLAELADVSARANRLQGQLNLTADEALVVSSLNQSEGVQEALVYLQNAQTELSEARVLYTDQHPQVITLLRKQTAARDLLGERINELLGQQNLSAASIQDGLGRLQLGDLRIDLMQNLAELDVQATGLERRLQELLQTRVSYEQQINNLPELENQQRQLERQLSASQSTYETLLNQLQEIRVIENQTVGNVQIVSLADVPTQSVSRSSMLYLAGGGLLGILLAVATAFFLDLLDSSVKTLKEVKDLYGYTLLGVIPFVRENKQSRFDAANDALPRLLVNRSEYAGVREAYQILQANLKFLQADTQLKTVVVTSALPGEGKSEVSSNLAAALAQVGKKVLLIDADMRYPRQHHAFEIVNGEGLSHVITGQASLNSCIRSKLENLDLLTAGVVPPNPVTLLDSQRMGSLLQSLRQTYDMILIDSPPLSGYADALILGRLADGVLLVARPGVLNYAHGRSAREMLIQSQQQVLGIVANGVDPINEPDGQFYLRQDRSYSLSSSEAQVATVER